MQGNTDRSGALEDDAQVHEGEGGRRCWRGTIQAEERERGSDSGSGDSKGAALGDSALPFLSPGGREGEPKRLSKMVAGTRFWVLAGDCSDESELEETATQGNFKPTSSYLDFEKQKCNVIEIEGIAKRDKKRAKRILKHKYNGLKKSKSMSALTDDDKNNIHYLDFHVIDSPNWGKQHCGLG